jgi:hypothetical protein
VPLKKVEIKGVFNGGISTVEVQLSYKNNEKSKIDCIFECPLVGNSIMISCTATFGDKLIWTNIEALEDAQKEV